MPYRGRVKEAEVQRIDKGANVHAEQRTEAKLIRRRRQRRQSGSGRAVFLDKDGTLIHDVPYNVAPERIRLMPGTAEGLQRLHIAGYMLVVTTNQSGVARGYFKEEALDGVEARLRELLAEFDVPLAGFYYCPHHPNSVKPAYATDCTCRKPAAGLLFQAARDHGIDCSQSWLIGDILNDIEAGRRAGCRTILVNTGGETEWKVSPDRMPHHIVDDIATAARVITAVQQPLKERSCVH